jgi:EmrB/QacA subfamily drug resistance transporter
MVVLALVSATQFMVILDLAVVNVAVPSIQADLGLGASDLQWVVITYGLTLGGFLLLGGRAADLVGRRRTLVAGLLLFAGASLVAGMAGSLGLLVASRAVQGLGAALASPAALSILTTTFAEGPARTKALGVFGAVSGSAASVGVIVSGTLTSGPGWEWVFLINVPIGVVLVALVLALIPDLPPAERGSADLVGAVTVTGGLIAVVYAINKSVDHGWTSPTTLGFLAAGVALLGAFVMAESRVRSPLVPLAVFRRRTLTGSIVVAALVFGSFFATIYQGTLFLQQALGYSAIDTGVAWLTSTISSLVVAGAVAPRVVGRIGPGATLAIGQSVQAAGLLYLVRVPADASYWQDLFPAFLAFGIGVGASTIAVQVAAFTGIEARISGLAGGLVETAREVGGALGTAIVATVAIARAEDVLAATGTSELTRTLAVTEGFQRGSLVAAALSLAAAVAAPLLLGQRAAAVTARAPALAGDAPAAHTSVPLAVDTADDLSVPIPVDTAPDMKEAS